MGTLSYAFEWLGYSVGAVLHLFLIGIVARKRKAPAPEKLLLAALCAAGVWHLASASPIWETVLFGSERLSLQTLAAAGLVLVPAFLLHLALLWTGFSPWFSVSGYLPAPALWWMLATGRPGAAHLWVALLLVATAILLFLHARDRAEDFERRFFRVFAASLLLPVAAGILAGVDSPAVALFSLAAPLCLIHFIYWYHLLDLLISRRVVFALTLGLACAVYLLGVKLISDWLGSKYRASEALVEIALILAAGLIWIPLYGWMTRFLSKRTQVYADFSKRILEEAARILDLEERLQFMAGELGRTFHLHGVLLVTGGEPRLRGTYGANRCSGGQGPCEKIEGLVRESRPEVVHLSRDPESQLAQALGETGFNYLFPLWYEEHLTGLLFLDTAPLRFLDENETILLGLSRQISHSIETGRIVEEKIGLERALARQEHLASLGTVAATIAHEIKNPLSTVKTLAQLMREDPGVHEKYDRDLDYMIGEVDRLNRSVHQLLSFSRPAPEDRREVDVTELLETMADFFERQQAGSPVRICHRIAPGLKLRSGDPELVRQVVLNLMLNAIQASEPAGDVRLEAHAAGGKVVLSVGDHGHGIPAAIREKIFEPFFTTRQRGTGLGLAIVRKNVRQLGGEIRIESPIDEGRGSRVVVTLPSE